jgi:hypothetical protein
VVKDSNTSQQPLRSKSVGLLEQITDRFLLLSGHAYSTISVRQRGFHGKGQEVRTTNGVQRRSRLRDVQASEASLGELKSIYSTHIGFPTLAMWHRQARQQLHEDEQAIVRGEAVRVAEGVE